MGDENKINPLTGLDLGMQLGITPLPPSPPVVLPTSLPESANGWNDTDRMDLLTLDNANIQKVRDLLDGSRNFREACDMILDRS